MQTNLLRLSLFSILIGLSVSCSDNNNDSGAVMLEPTPPPAIETATYVVNITNLTNSQPFSPAAIIIHQAGYTLFVDGEPASVALEELAEGGNPNRLVIEASSANSVIKAVQIDSSTPPRSIGNDITIEVPLSNISNMMISLATMLVNTNDAFTALNAVNISDMVVGDALSFTAPSWDAGTESNLETADTMPGPAAINAGGGGEVAGFSATRDDLLDKVHLHPGVVTNANAMDASKEGLASSVLGEGDRWDNPTSKIIISRTR